MPAGFVQIFGCKIQGFFPEFFQTQGYQMAKERSLEAKPLDKRRNKVFPRCNANVQPHGNADIRLSVLATDEIK